DLFGKTKRTFSSGCIRLEKPVEVGEFILRNRENWNKEKIEKAMFSGKERIEELKTDEKVPLHVIYLTFSADDNEKVQFKNDVYGYDKEYAKILQMKKL
ncbi:MAG: L,D-transpeptidase, partial [Deltaproteobacteria bacterium CG07_land_8_20_14_0_80_38_7]